MSEQIMIKVYNEEDDLVAINIEQALELLELNGYKVLSDYTPFTGVVKEDK